MDRSPGFGSTPTDSLALFRLGFPSAPDLQALTSPASVTRRTVLQKVRGSTFKVVPQLVNIWFQVLFHSPPGVLFTFPSQYYALSVTKEYLALRGGPRVLPTRFHVSRGTLDPAMLTRPFTYGAFTLSGWLSQNHSAKSSWINSAVRTPECTHSGLGSSGFARRYLRNHMLSFSSSGYLDVSVHRVPLHNVMDWRYGYLRFAQVGFPIQTSPDHMDICSSPKLFAAYHVFHRLLVPRHPPYALI